jgi:hypothetical protein
MKVRENDMRVSRTILSFVLILLTAGFALGKIRIDYDHSVNFSKYKTFMWLEEPNTDDPFMKSRITNAVNSQLLAKGLEEAEADADLGIKVTSSTKEIQTLNTFYSGFDSWGWGSPAWGWGPGWGWGWDGPGWATTTVDTSLEATTIVDLFDSATEKPVWRGVSQGSISDKPEKATKKTVKKIAEMFEDFPPGRDSD